MPTVEFVRLSTHRVSDKLTTGGRTPREAEPCTPTLHTPLYVGSRPSAKSKNRWTSAWSRIRLGTWIYIM